MSENKNTLYFDHEGDFEIAMFTFLLFRNRFTFPVNSRVTIQIKSSCFTNHTGVFTESPFF